jgi:hypothetical protein
VADFPANSLSFRDFAERVNCGKLKGGIAMFVKDLGKSAERFKQGASARAGDYVEQAAGAANRWKANTEAAADNWAAGVQEAANRGAFGRGLSKVGADYYAQRVRKLGQARYGQGVAEGAGNWQEGFKPYADALSSLQQSPRGLKGSAQNQQRSVEVQIKLRQVKTGQAA